MVLKEGRGKGMASKKKKTVAGGGGGAKTGQKNIPAMPRLGESKYKPSYCEKLWRYFMEYNDRGIPQKSQFARQIRVDEKTLRNWRNTHEDFAVVYEACMDYQRELLNNGGLTGTLNPRMVQFVLSANHKVREYTRIKVEDKAVDVEMSAADRNLMLAIEQRLLRGGHEELAAPEDMLNEGAIPQEEATDGT
jgi:hypothetical protein